MKSLRYLLGAIVGVSGIAGSAFAGSVTLTNDALQIYAAGNKVNDGSTVDPNVAGEVHHHDRNRSVEDEPNGYDLGDDVRDQQVAAGLTAAAERIGIARGRQHGYSSSSSAAGSVAGTSSSKASATSMRNASGSVTPARRK